MSLNWSVGVEPAKLKDFESRARNLRYQALGRACRDFGISSLLLAHHEDDNVETTLVRLAQARKGSGFRGMSLHAQLPECRGRYGVCESGEYKPDQSKQTCEATVTGPESGGICITRPLLSFPKSRLVATCEEAAIKWVEDPTNQDSTLTIRNTVRKLLGSGQLPRALQKQSILKLIRLSQIKQQAYDDHAQELFQACKVEMFDIHSGTIAVDIPQPESIFGQDEYSRWSIGYREQVLTTFLRRLVRFVTPLEIVNNEALKTICYTVFSWKPLKLDSISSDVTTPLRARINGAGVLFNLKSPTCEPDAKGFRSWYIHRQPYPNGKRPPTLRYPQITSQEPHLNDEGDKFQLWDGRFWIQVESQTEFPVVIEPFSTSSSHAFRNALLPGVKRRLAHMLDTFAPARARWTLPSISIAPEVDWKDPNRIIALPTLGIIVEGWEDKIKWDIRYKKVEMPQDMKSQLVPPATDRYVDAPLYIFVKPSTMSSAKEPG